MFSVSCRAFASAGQRRVVRCYVSRAHPKPTPVYPIPKALEKVLTGIEERKEKRATKWERNAPARARKGITDTGPYRNQDETVELAVALNLDPRKPGQALRGSLSLPHGTGKIIKCVVFTDDKTIAEAALENGAIHAGGETLVNQIARGDVPLDFDRSVASQNMMSDLSKIARSLGPRGLMPNPKVGTLVKQPDMLLEALKQQMDGQLMYRTDKEGVLHLGVGKGSFGPDKLLDNIRTTMEEIYNIKPEMYGKGKKPSKNAVYMLTAHVTATQGKGIKVDLPTITPTSKAFMSDGE